MGWKGCLAERWMRRISLHTWRDVRVSGVVMRQKAARVFMTGRGLPERMARPWAVARCRAKCAFRRNSWTARG